MEPAWRALQASHGPSATSAQASAAAACLGDGRGRRTHRMSKAGSAPSANTLVATAPPKRKPARRRRPPPARTAALGRRGRHQKRRRPVHVGRTQLQHRQRKGRERQDDERGRPTFEPQPPAERERRAEDRDADAELQQPDDAFAPVKKAEREVRVVIAPEQRVRHEVRTYRHAPERGDVARLGQVVGQTVPRHIGREGSHPRGEEREPREGQPRGLDPCRGISPRQPATRQPPNSASARGLPGSMCTSRSAAVVLRTWSRIALSAPSSRTRRRRRPTLRRASGPCVAPRASSDRTHAPAR